MDKNASLLALYEISMSIGNTLDLDKMLNVVVTMILSRLNCSSAAIYEDLDGNSKLLYAKPKVLINNEVYVTTVEVLKQKFFNCHQNSVVEKVGDKYYYLFELKNFGCFVLTKANDPLDEHIFNSLSKINLKLLAAIQACIDNTKLKESQANLTEVQSITHLGSWNASYRSRSFHWDDEVFRILGEEPQSYTPTYKDVLRHLPKEGQKRARKAITEVLTRRKCNYEGVFTLIKKDGSTAYVQIKSRATFNKEGRPLHLVGSMLDITNEHQLEQQIREESALLKSIINTVPVRIFWKDRELHYLGCNNLFAHDAGLKDQNELIGKSDYDMPWKSEADQYRADDKMVMDSGIAKLNFEEQQTISDGSEVWRSTSKVPLNNEKGKTYGLLGSYQDITARKEDEKKLQLHSAELKYQAYHDTLTELPNRLLLLDRLCESIKKAQRSQNKVAVMFIDLDRFKEINDSLGHDFGDQVIREVARRLRHQIRATDTIARFGGDEFVMVLDNIDNPIVVVDISQKLMEAMAAPIVFENHSVYVTLSIGVSIYPDDGETTDTLLKNADAAMYKAKGDGRNDYQFYTQDMTERAFERIVMETSLREGIEHEEFLLYYQPQGNGESDAIIGMEALIRWQHSSMGLVPPDKFIPISEETGLIVPLGKWILKTGMVQMVRWQEEGLNPGVLALNLSLKQLKEHDFIIMLEEMLTETGCRAEWLAFELTESQIMQDPEYTILLLKQISCLGIEIAIDDFGTGYSSLSYLKRLPIDKLKIDRSFVKDIPGDEEDTAIAKAVIALSKSLNLHVIAEGVETQEQKMFLVENGCINIQGYFYSRPMPVDEMTEMLRSSK